jgi:hypothetical protein
MIGLCSDIHPSNVDLKSTDAKIPPNGQRKNESTFCSNHGMFTTSIFHKIAHGGWQVWKSYPLRNPGIILLAATAVVKGRTGLFCHWWSVV